MLFRELNAEEFIIFAKNHPQFTHYQTPNEASLKEIAGWEGYYVGVINDDKIIAAAFIMRKKVPYVGKYIFESPRGLLIDYHDLDTLKFFTDNLKTFIKKKKGIFLFIDPYVLYRHLDKSGQVIDEYKDDESVNNLISLGYRHTGFVDGYQNIQPRYISVVNIKNKTYDEIYENYESTRKKQISLCTKLGIYSRPITFEELPEFVKLEGMVGKRRGFSTRPLEYYEKMWNAFYPEYMNIVVTKMDIDKAIVYYETLKNEILDNRQKNQLTNSHKNEKKENEQLNSFEKKINDLLILKEKYGHEATASVCQYMILPNEVIAMAMANNDDFMKYNITVSNFDWAIKNSIEAKKDIFNFYGVSGDFTNSNGVYKMKKEFGATIDELIGEFHLIISPLWYKAYNIARKIL